VQKYQKKPAPSRLRGLREVTLSVDDLKHQSEKIDQTANSTTLREEFERLLEEDLRLQAEILADELRQDWSRHFPSEAFSEAALEREVSALVARKRTEHLSKLDAMLSDYERGEMLGRGLRRYGGLILTVLVSLYTFPALTWLFFQPSNPMLYAGAGGLLVNIIILGICGYRAFQKGKGSES